MRRNWSVVFMLTLFLLFSNKVMAAEIIEYDVPGNETWEEEAPHAYEDGVADEMQEEEVVPDELTQPVLTEVKAVSPSSIKVSWTSDGNCRGVYAIYRKKPGKTFGVVGYVKATSAKIYSFTDITVVAKQKYFYSVRPVASDNLVEVLESKSKSYNDYYVEETLSWNKPSTGEVFRYVVFDGDHYVGDVAASEKGIIIRYSRGYTPDLNVYAVLKGGWGAYDKTGLSAKTTIPTSKVKSTKLVATNKIRVNWTKAKGVTGYKIYRRKKGTKDWTLATTIKGDNQLYCYYGSIKAKTTYYFTVKPYVKTGSKTVYASFNKTGTKAYYKSVTVSPKKGDFSKGSVYGPSLSTSKLKEVKKAVTNFHKKYITSDMTNLERVVAAQLFMMRYCTYADDWSQNGANTAWGSLVYKNKQGLHEAQCSGFARGFKALCDAMGVPCRYVHANNNSYNPSHQWNQVKIDGKWYIVDPQCNSTSGGFVFFLCSGKTYRECSGMRWNTGDLPKLAAQDYPMDKLEKACNGYKLTRIYNMMFN